jgi:hypothetical protein
VFVYAAIIAAQIDQSGNFPEVRLASKPMKGLDLLVHFSSATR